MRIAALVAATALIPAVLVAATPASTNRTLPIKQRHTEKRTVRQACPGVLQRIERHRQTTWQLQRQLNRNVTTPSSRPVRSCQYGKWVEAQWWQRTVVLRRELARRTLPVSNDWQTAVRIVQRAFPGTQSWLLSCSSAEGDHGAWVMYGGRPYYPGAEYARTWWGPMVGGPLQYMWGTFKGHYRHGLESLRARGFIVDLPGPDDVAAWRSMTGQAVAGGWARWSGSTASHWSASWGRGC